MSRFVRSTGFLQVAMVSLVSGMIAIGIVGAMSGQQPAVLASAGFCGDGVVNQSGEECDGSAGVGVGQTCTSGCKIQNAPFCGDGVVNQTGEECDGSAGVGIGQTCTSGCKIQNAPFCGDGVVNQTGEECDGSAGVGVGQTCTSGCKIQNAPFCGDGIVNQTGEECDGSAGVGVGQTCTSGCKIQNAPFCGDGVVNQTGEECDGSAGVGVGQTCTSGCKIQGGGGGGGAFCGDGILNQTGEECDGSAGVGPGQFCNTGCKLASAPFCGDGVVNQAGEECDGSAGVGTGQSCTSGCKLQTTDDNGDDGNGGGGGGGPTTSGGGGGGGGLPLLTIHTISTNCEGTDTGNVVVTWHTNLDATTRVVYGPTSVPTIGFAPNYGYPSSTAEDTSVMKRIHSVTISGLTAGATYYFRPISAFSRGEKYGVEVSLVACSSGQTAATVTKTASLTFTNPGGVVDYQVTVTNPGTTILDNIIAVDTLPEGLTYADTGLTVRTWELARLNPGQSETFTYQVKVSDTASEGIYENIVNLFQNGSQIDQASYGLEVRKGTVLGEELPDTTSSVLGWYYLAASMLLTSAGGSFALVISRRRNLIQGINFLKRM